MSGFDNIKVKLAQISNLTSTKADIQITENYIM